MGVRKVPSFARRAGLAASGAFARKAGSALHLLQLALNRLHQRSLSTALGINQG